MFPYKTRSAIRTQWDTSIHTEIVSWVNSVEDLNKSSTPLLARQQDSSSRSQKSQGKRTPLLLCPSLVFPPLGQNGAIMNSSCCHLVFCIFVWIIIQKFIGYIQHEHFSVRAFCEWFSLPHYCQSHSRVELPYSHAAWQLLACLRCAVSCSVFWWCVSKCHSTFDCFIDAILSLQIKHAAHTCSLQTGQFFALFFLERLILSIFLSFSSKLLH